MLQVRSSAQNSLSLSGVPLMNRTGTEQRRARDADCGACPLSQYAVVFLLSAYVLIIDFIMLQ